MVDGGWWWMDGQRKSKKIMYFKNFSNTIRYFFLVVSRPLRRVFKTFSRKNSKKNEIFILCKKFRTFFFFSDFFDFLSSVVVVIWLYLGVFSIDVFDGDITGKISTFSKRYEENFRSWKSGKFPDFKKKKKDFRP